MKPQALLKAWRPRCHPPIRRRRANAPVTRGSRRIAPDVLTYFPQPYQDELVYSLVARYGRHTGMIGAEPLGLALFGSKRQRPAYDVPIRIQALASRIPARQGLTAVHLINLHTLFPYYAAFLAADDAAEILRDVMGDRGGSKVRLYLGSDIRTPKRLRFCPECRDAMLRDFGELYWRREQQIPWVVVCPIHGCSLRSSGVVAGGRAFTYVPATTSNCDDRAEELAPGLETSELADLCSIAQQAREVLLTGTTPLREPGSWRADFRARCSDKGLMMTSGHVNRVKMKEAVLARFGYLARIWPELMELRGKENWVSKLNWDSAPSINPVWTFIADRTLSGIEANLDPLGPGPWPCRNEAAHHFEMRVIDAGARRIVDAHRTALFACTCGWTHTSHRRRRADGSLPTPTYVDFGTELRQGIAQAAEDGLGIATTARRLGVSPKLVWAAAEAHDVAGRSPWRRFMVRKARRPDDGSAEVEK